jgi:hypothetical protein
MIIPKTESEVKEESKVPFFNYWKRAIAIYVATIIILSYFTYQVDLDRHGSIATRVTIIPEVVSLGVDSNDTMIKRLEIKFEQSPINVNAFVEGPGLGNLIKLHLARNSDLNYFLYVNVTAPGNQNFSAAFEGAVRLTYDIKVNNKSNSYEKIIPLNLNITHGDSKTSTCC